MSNPIFSSNNSNDNVSNCTPLNQKSLLAIFNQVRNSPSPDQTMQQLLNNNPQYQNVMNYIDRTGGDARSAFYNLAAQIGVDPEQILSQLR